MKRITMCAATFMLAAASLTGCGGEKQKIAVQVNNDSLTEEAFNQRVRDVNAANLQLSASMNGPARAGEYAMMSAVYEMLLSQLAAEKKAVPTDAEVTAYIPFAKRWAQFPPITFMAQDPLRTDADWRREARLALMRRKMIIPALKLTDAELKTTYEKIKKEITPADQYHIRLVDTKTRDKAEKALEALKKGIAFETVALTQSEEPASKARNGDIGTVPAPALPKEFITALDKLKPGQYTPQVVVAGVPKQGVEVQPGVQPPLDTHYFVLQLVEKIPGKTPTLDESRMLLESYLVQQKDPAATQRLQAAVDEFRKKAGKDGIKINIKEYANLLDRLNGPPAGAAPAGAPVGGAPAPGGAPGG